MIGASGGNSLLRLLHKTLNPKPYSQNTWTLNPMPEITLNPKPNAQKQQPGPQKFKLSKIELIYKAKKFKVPPFTI